MRFKSLAWFLLGFVLPGLIWAALAASPYEFKRVVPRGVPNKLTGDIRWLDPACEPDPACEYNPIDSIPDDRKRAYEKWILEAANRFEIHPAVIKSLIHIESTFDPLADAGNGISKGLCQMGHDSTAFRPALEIYLVDESKKSQLQLNQLGWSKIGKPRGMSEALSDHFNLRREITLTKLIKNGKQVKKTFYKREAYSVWSPRGQILAAANYLKILGFHSSHAITVPGPNGLGVDVTQALFGPFDVNAGMGQIRSRDVLTEIERARYLLVRYNKGAWAVTQGVRKFVAEESAKLEAQDRKSKTQRAVPQIALPQYFGQAWYPLSDERVRAEVSSEFGIKSYNRGRCYVQSTAGLCGFEKDSYIMTYLKEYAQVKMGQRLQWQLAR